MALWAAQHGGLGADPGKDIQHFTGITALKFLLATLLVSPLARYAKQPLLFRTRRLLGLWCFAWATLHMASYALLELGIQNLGLLGRELVSRPWLTPGMTGWIILFLLMLTSTQAAQRKMGKRWQTLHYYVYGRHFATAALHMVGKSVITAPYYLRHLFCGSVGFSL